MSDQPDETGANWPYTVQQIVTAVTMDRIGRLAASRTIATCQAADIVTPLHPDAARLDLIIALMEHIRERIPPDMRSSPHR